MQKTAVLSGANGQDGSYLAELLLGKGYKVYGIVRRSSVNTLERLAGVLDNPDFVLVEGDITDAASVSGIITQAQPDEVYNLAAQSHVGSSFEQPVATIMIDAVGPLNFLEAIRRIKPNCRFYQASTSELFGDTTESPQSETTRFQPASPYAIAKLAAHNSVALYRRAYGLYACAGILFNHESIRRGELFVTRKITRYVAKLAKAIQEGCSIPRLKLGNLDARRDWGFAGDYVEAMWLMLQQDQPEDFVIATGQTWTIKQFLQEAFGFIGIDWDRCVEVDPSCLRPADVNLLCGDASRAYEKLGWLPKTSFRELVREMVLSDMALEGVVTN